MDDERSFRVDWGIDIEAGSPGEAAAQAAAIQKRPFPDSSAHYFTVTDKATGKSTDVDLDEGEHDEHVAAAGLFD